MGNILEAFLTDQLRVDSGTKRRTPEHQELCEKKYRTSKTASRNAERQTKSDTRRTGGNTI